MKKLYSLILCVIIICSQNIFSQSIEVKDNANSQTLSNTNIQLMVLDSVIDAYNLDRPFVYEYDSYGRLIISKSRIKKYEFTYDNYDNIINTVFYVWDYDSNYHCIRENREYLYDNNQNLISIIISNIVDNALKLNFKTLKEYNNNQLTKDNYYNYNPDSNSWTYTGRTEYYYNADNLISEEKTYYIIQGLEQLYCKFEYSYDSNNNIISYIDECYSEEGEISNGSKTLNTYNTNNLLTQVIFEYFYTYDNTWIPLRKQEFTYNPNNLMASSKTFAYYTTTDCVLQSIDSFYFDNNNNQTLINTFTDFNDEMICTRKTKNLFEYNYTQQDILQFSDKLGNLKPKHLDGLNNMLTHIAYSRFNYDDINSWNNDSTYLFYSLKNIVISLSEVISFNGQDFLLYPNPANTEAKLVVEGLNQDLKILIYDIKGKLIENIKASPINEKVEVVINTRNLRKGTYIINLKSGKYSNSKKLIVN